MNGRGIGRRERQALRRLVVLLLALAALAERASVRSGPAGGFLLWLLRWGEGVACNHVCETIGRPPVALCPIAQRLALATRFRALAAALAAFIVRLPSCSGPRSAAEACLPSLPAFRRAVARLDSS